MPDKEKLYVEGMHGLGDTFHQRGVIKMLVEKYDVWLETSWPSLYYDLPIHCVANGTELRTQLKNVERELARFETPSDEPIKRIKIRYTADSVRKYGSVYAAMMRDSGFTEEDTDFRFKVPEEWLNRIDVTIKSWNTNKPILFYRPLVVRKEWKNCARRNPHLGSYVALLREIREKFFVVSIADLKEGVEWEVSESVAADRTYNNGELDSTELIALVSRSALVFASPGFAVPMARAVGTPVVCVFGGFESSRSFTHGYGPYLGIDTVRPCECFSKTHVCVKRIDLPAAKNKLRSFVDVIVTKG